MLQLTVRASTSRHKSPNGTTLASNDKCRYCRTNLIEDGIYKVLNVPDETLGNRQNQQQIKFRAMLGQPIAKAFPLDTDHFAWNILNFGPLYVPRSGDKIVIDSVNYLLYNKLIAYETNDTLKLQNGEIFLGDSLINEYRFRMNYYFMAGDFAENSVDSRHWGLVPEDHIIGKAILIWKSKDTKTGKIRWGRVGGRIK